MNCHATCKWRIIVCEKDDASKPIVFSELADFVKREAKKAKHPIYSSIKLAEGNIHNSKIKYVFATQIQKRDIWNTSDKTIILNVINVRETKCY